MLIKRRGLLIGLASALAAPAIVRATSLMPIKEFRPDYVAYYWRTKPFKLGEASRWEHIALSVDGSLLEAKQYINGALAAEGRICDLQIFKGKKLIEWYPLDSIAPYEGPKLPEPDETWNADTWKELP